MHNLRDIASALCFRKVHSIVPATVMFATHGSSTGGPYIVHHPLRSEGLTDLLIGPNLSFVQMFFFDLSLGPIGGQAILGDGPPVNKVLVALLKGKLNNAEN